MLTKAEDDGICTGHDKLREMKKIIEKRTKLGVVLTVYVGDSNTDLPCLLHADIGILIGDGRSVLETCERLGIWVESGRSMKDMSRKARADKKEQILYHFENWHSIINSGILD
jgi:thiamine phosphate phosphatase / amino-HMP aminohydrolase